jgi:hypothetical protein
MKTLNHFSIYTKTSFVTTFVLWCLFTCSSCKKTPDQSCGSCPVGGGSGVAQDGVSFTKTGNITYTADSAYFLSVSNTLVAYYQGNAHKLVLKTTSPVAGNYAITATTNRVTYTEATGTYVASGGSINITSNASTKISGDFLSNGTGAGIIGLSGQFTNISKR